jgi:hypothetical protein
LKYLNLMPKFMKIFISLIFKNLNKVIFITNIVNK